MKIICVLIIFLTLFACHRNTVREPTPVYQWVKEAQTDQQFQKDKYECEYQAQIIYSAQAITFGGFLPLITYRKNVNQCMMARGYVYKEIPSQ